MYVHEEISAKFHPDPIRNDGALAFSNMVVHNNNKNTRRGPHLNMEYPRGSQSEKRKKIGGYFFVILQKRTLAKNWAHNNSRNKQMKMIMSSDVESVPGPKNLLQPYCVRLGRAIIVALSLIHSQVSKYRNPLSCTWLRFEQRNVWEAVTWNSEALEGRLQGIVPEGHWFPAHCEPWR